MGNDAGHIRSHCSTPLGACVGSRHQARSSALHGLRLTPFSKRTSCLPGMKQVVFHLQKLNSTPLLIKLPLPWPPPPRTHPCLLSHPPQAATILSDFVRVVPRSLLLSGLSRAREAREGCVARAVALMGRRVVRGQRDLCASVSKSDNATSRILDVCKV